ncbi:MAG TPA: hypothetical protein VFU02_01655 [Polyangiaceae bacterium]|nr:hypothetical protein [Polyangiaceae bacterium]
MKRSTGATILAMASVATAAAAEEPPRTPPVEQTPGVAAPTVEPEPGAAAEDANTEALRTQEPRLGLALGVPDTGAPPGRLRTTFGQAPVSRGEGQFDFHGYLSVPLRMGIDSREDPDSAQYESVFHAPPLVPDDRERFEHTGVMPQPWTQLNFSYGNSKAIATIIIASETASNAAGYVNPPDHIGITDAFVTFEPGLGIGLEIDVGGFTNRYGGMGEYDLGRYDTPLIARVGGVGETARVRVPLGPGLGFLAEHGLVGHFDRAQLGVKSAGWNDSVDPNVGTTFAHHGHLGLARADLGQLGVHYVQAFTGDDRVAATVAAGSINVLGADVAGEFQRFGHLYLAFAYTEANDAPTVSSMIRVLNAPGGPGLMSEYFGPNSGGNGSLTTLGGQYDVSIGEIARHPERFTGYGPDLIVSAFSVFTHVASAEAAFDGVGKLKYGAELSYSAASWLGFSGRYDRVIDDLDDDTKTFAVVSPRIIFRTDYDSQDQVTLQYSRWLYGSGVNVRAGYPEEEGESIRPDEHTLSLNVNMWW